MFLTVMQNNQESAVSGTAKFDIVADGDISIRQPAVQTHSTHQKGHIELFSDFPLMKPSMDPRSFQNPSQGSMSLETKRREQMMADLWSHSTGVSQNQFLSVVRELKRTKNALKEAQQKLNKISVLVSDFLCYDQLSQANFGLLLVLCLIPFFSGTEACYMCI